MKGNVFVVGGSSQYERMLRNNGFDIVDDVEDATIVQFTGGEDVSPGLYQQEAHPRSFFNEMRDAFELDLFDYCEENSIPMLGICRGGQFLNVANGGSMWQHVNNHAVGGTHLCIDTRRGTFIEVSSTHHQMMIPSDEAEVIAVASESTWKESVKDGDLIRIDAKRGEDIEVVWYPETRSLCFQPHPEFFDKQHPCQEYYFSLISELVGV